ncbi:maleate cis-trans isomerase family protein [Pollutimonas nitritireducens]|nr:hypothetical protein [Pollutimonas nitritireducens]
MAIDSHTWPPFDEATKTGSASLLRERPPVRARLGIILPGVNTVVEPWFGRVVGADISVHASRMLLTSQVTAEALQRMDHEEGMDAAACIASCRPDVIAYGCTASSIVQGLDYDKRLQQALEAETGKPCFTAVGAIIDALRVLGIHKISIASPYTDAIDHAEKQLFETAGFRVLGTANLNIRDSFELASPDARQIYELARRAWHPDADALLISCLNMNSQEIVELLENRMGRPVITSPTAVLWKLLRTAGLQDRITGYGSLLAIH